MIKRFLMITAVLLLAIILLLCWYLRPMPSVEALLPKNPVLYIKLHQMNNLSQTFESSAFFKKLKEIPIQDILKYNNINNKIEKKIDHYIKVLTKLKNNFFFKEILNQDILVLGYLRDKKLEDWIMAVRLNPWQNLRYEALPFYFKYDQRLKWQDAHENGLKFKILNYDGVKFRIFKRRDVILIVPQSTSLSLVVKALNANENETLLKDAHYEFALKHFYASSYVNIYVSIGEIINNFLPENARQAFDELPMKLTTGVVSIKNDNGWRWKFVMDRKVSSEMSSLYECPKVSGRLDSLHLVPATVMLYQWSNCLDLNKLISINKEMIKKTPRANISFEQMLGMINNYFKVDIMRDIVPLIGEEAGWYITDIDTKAAFPYVRFLFFVKINDKDKTRDIFLRLKDKIPFPLEKENYHDQDLYYGVLPFGSNTDPSFAIIKDYLLISSTRQLLKKSLDTFDDPARSLSEDGVYQRIGLKDNVQGSSLMFMRVDTFATRLKDLWSWAERYMLSQLGTEAGLQRRLDEEKEQAQAFITEKDEELQVAKSRLQEVNAKPLADQSASQKDLLQKDIKQLQEDIASAQHVLDSQQKQIELFREQERMFKKISYNFSQIAIPFFDAMGTIEAQSFVGTQSKEMTELEWRMP